MLTFSEALTQLKAGQDMRVSTWPRSRFVRATRTPAGPVLQVRTHNATPTIYQPTQAEMFGQDWTQA